MIKSVESYDSERFAAVRFESEKDCRACLERLLEIGLFGDVLRIDTCIIFPRERLDFVQQEIANGTIIPVQPLGTTASRRRPLGRGLRPEYDDEAWLRRETARLEAENRVVINEGAIKKNVNPPPTSKRPPPPKAQAPDKT
jgi:hypothetical protein